MKYACFPPFDKYNMQYDWKCSLSFYVTFIIYFCLPKLKVGLDEDK